MPMRISTTRYSRINVTTRDYFAPSVDFRHASPPKAWG